MHPERLTVFNATPLWLRVRVSPNEKICIRRDSQYLMLRRYGYAFESPRMKKYASGETRTPDPLVRSQMLYPAELRMHIFLLYGKEMFFSIFTHLNYSD